MTGPCTDIEPITAKRYSTGLLVANERWVSNRWKPTVTPNPVTTYITAKRTRSCRPTPLPHRSTTATMKAMNGMITASRFEIWPDLDMSRPYAQVRRRSVRQRLIGQA